MRVARTLGLAAAVAALALFAGAASAAGAAAGYVVIVHPDNPSDALSKKEVSRLLLRQRSRWEDGVAAAPVDLADSPARRAFSRDVHGRSVASIKNYWQRQIFSGDGVPPPEAAGDAEVVAHVRSHRGGIGYVSSTARLDGVKVLEVAD